MAPAAAAEATKGPLESIYLFSQPLDLLPGLLLIDGKHEDERAPRGYAEGAHRRKLVRSGRVQDILRMAGRVERRAD